MKTIVLFFNKLLVVLLFFSISIISVKAQKGDPNLVRNDSHFFTISISGGVTSFSLMPLPDTMRVTSKAFLGGNLGLGYEWHHSSGVWFGLGLEAQLLTAKLENTQDIYHIDEVVDAEGDVSDITYNIVKWKERERVLMANLPIVVGYKTMSGFYFGAGVKVGVGVYGDITSDFRFTDCTLYYQKYPPMHLRESVEATNAFAVDNGFVGKLNLSPTFEIGWQGLDIPGQTKYDGAIRFKFALCGEFGALSIYSNATEGNLLEYGNLNGFDDVRKVMDLIDGINSYYSVMPIGISAGKFDEIKSTGVFNQYAKPSNLHPWFVGVKFGVMFEMPKKKNCNCLQNNIIKPWDKKRKDRGVE